MKDLQEKTEWKKLALENLCVEKGLVRGPFGGSLKKAFFVKEGYKVYEQKNAIYRDVSIGDYFIDENKFNELKRFEVREGDFIVSCSGTIGRIFRIPPNAPKGVINQALLKIEIDKNKIDSEYFYQYFSWDRFQKRITDNTQGGAMQNLVGMGEFRKTKLLIPSLKEQQKIASILSTWDNAIELKEKLIEQKKQQKKGLMQKLLTGEVRLPGFKEDWKEIRLGDFLIKHNEKSQFNNQYPVLTSSRKGIFLQKDYYLGNEVASEDNTGYNVVPYEYFTYRHMSDDLTFKFNINDIVEKGIVSTLYPVFTTKKQLNSRFLLLKLNEGNEFKRFALKQKQGGSRTYMYYSKLEELQLVIPSLEEQKKIAQFLSIMDKNTQLLEAELDNLQLQKKGLMQVLLTGKVQVKV